MGSGKSSTTSSARIKTEAERATMLARKSALKEKHVLEEQEQQIRRKKEQQELKTMLTESATKLAVLQATDKQSCAKASNAVNSYLEKEMQQLPSTHRLDAMAKEFNYVPQSKPQQTREWSMSVNHQLVCCIKGLANCSQVDQRSGLDSNRQNYQCAPQTEQQSFRIKAQTTDQRQTGDIFTVIQKQNEITSALVQQQHLSPSRDIPLFDGDPLQYIAFI